MDLTGGDNGEFPNARRSIDDAVKTLRRVDSVAANRFSARLAPYLTRFSTQGYSSFTIADKAELGSLLNEIRTTLTQKKPALLANGGQADYERVQHDIVVAQQLNHMFAISPPPSRGIPADGDAMVSARNEAMADNVRWLLEREGPKGRILVFAHNMHVMNSTLQGGPWAKFRHPSSSTGQFLRSALGSDLVIIGGAAATTSGSLPPMEKNPASFDDALSQLAAPRFLLDLRASADNPAVSKWLSEPMPMHANVFDHLIVSPRPAFDAVYFIETLTIARVPE